MPPSLKSQHPPHNARRGKSKRVTNFDEVTEKFFEDMTRRVEEKKFDSVKSVSHFPQQCVKCIMKQELPAVVGPIQIAGDSVNLMSFASMAFISHLTLLASKLSMEPDEHRVLQAEDIKRAMADSSKFDFLVDTVDIFDAKQKFKKELVEKKKQSLKNVAVKQFGEQSAPQSEAGGQSSDGSHPETNDSSNSSTTHLEEFIDTLGLELSDEDLFSTLASYGVSEDMLPGGPLDTK